MNATVAFWLAVLGLVVTSLSAIAADAFTEFSRTDLEAYSRRRKSPHRLGQVLRGYRHVVLAAETLQAVATALFVGGTMLWVWEVTPSGQWPGAQLIVGTLATGALALLAMEIWLPWAVARLWAAPLVYHAWPTWRAIAWLLAPLLLGARIVDTVLHRLAGRNPEPADEESFEEEIRTIVSEGHREGLLEEDAREMIEGVIQLGGVDVSQIMTPRTDMLSLSLAKTWDEVIEFAIQAEHTRIPVYNKNRDDIVGILYTKDLLAELAKPSAERTNPWAKLLREPYFVPETKPVDVLLQEFQRSRQHLAVVLDEYGGVSGVVSLEDVLEEIVGDIGDEYDEEQIDDVRELSPGVAEVRGRAHIDELNERLGVSLPETADYDTIAGLVFSELGHIPVVGEQLVCRQVRITVIEATNRRIEKLRVENLAGAKDGGTDPSLPSG